MRAVVTGGAGFIGSHLIEALVARGDDVVCVEHPQASTRWLREMAVDYRAHGLGDLRQLTDTLDGADVVFHLAGLTQARRAADYYEVNTEGTARLLQAAARHRQLPPRVILASSIAAVGPCRAGTLLSPDSVPRPLSHYGHSKLLAEVMVHAYADRVPAVILRLASVYGPRERAVLMFFRLMQHGIGLTIGSWDREVSLLYVGDLVQAFLGAADSDRAVGHTYCVAHPTPLTWRAFASAVAEELDRHPILVSVPRSVAHVVACSAELGAFLRRTAALLNRGRVRELTQGRWVCDVSRTIRELGFRPAFPLQYGVHLTAAWYKEVGWI